MKFWKNLSNLIDQTLPDWQDKFLSYKDLKKQLKLIYPKEGDGASTSTSRPNKRPRLATDDDATAVAGAVTKEVIDFATLLEEEIEKFNAFFLDKVEEYIIVLEVLQDRVSETHQSYEELMAVLREIVDFHGEMVLLLNYSALNYTGLVKILKKYDKRSGALIRLPFIQKVLQEPFFETDVLNNLVRECERMLDRFFSMNVRFAPYQAAAAATSEAGEANTKAGMENGDKLQKVPEDLAEIKNIESMYMRQTLTALEVLNKIRGGSSTVSVFSLPPLQMNESEDVWKKISAIEQAAK